MTPFHKNLPTIDVIIVNYCTRTLVVACLDSLEMERKNVPNMRVIVVDNDSQDGSAELIEAVIQDREWHWVTLLRAGANRGFGAGNNLGISFALDQPSPADLLWFLNPDTEVRLTAGQSLARFMGSHPAAGIGGSALLESDGKPWPFAFRFPSILGEIERGARWGILSRLLRKSSTLKRMEGRCEQVDWVSGASFVVRRELMESGLRFDEGYFLYYEETDFCLHARRRGWECWYVPDAVVLHIAGQSTGVTGKQIKLRRLPSYWFHSRRRYFTKNHGRLYGIAADLAWIGAHIFSRLKHMVRGSDDPDPPNLLIDFLRHSSLVPRKFLAPRDVISV
ncbi:glycosyltransferase family 2 protein [Sphingobium aromaticiconvertens]|uniref:glycosyltransferase family 2 protein n=1 Tax=Sphingobium aromaticiconvertens TaxID=365341 RepID=UPI00301595DA